MGMPVVTVASGGMPIVEATRGTPVTEATNGRGVAVTKVVGKPGLPVVFEVPVTYATWDPATVTAVTLSGGNLIATNTGTTSNDQGAHVSSATAKTNGKYYFEIAFTNVIGTIALGVNMGAGIGTPTSTYTGMGFTGAVIGDMYYKGRTAYANGVKVAGPLGGGNGGVVVSTMVLCVAADLDNRKIWFREGISGDWNFAPGNDPTANIGGFTIPPGSMVPFVTFGGTGGSSGCVFTANFGSSTFQGTTRPVGFTPGWPAVTAAPAYSGPGDLITGWTAWYGLRAFSAAKAGTRCVQLGRASDGATLDILTDATGAPVLTAVPAFIASTTGFIKIWDDQSGNGFTIDTTYAAGDVFTLNAVGTRPGFDVHGSSHGTSITSAAVINQPYTLSCVAKRKSGGTSTIMGFDAYTLIFGASANTAGFYAGTINRTAPATDNVFHDIVAVVNGASSIVCIDGVDTASGEGTSGIAAGARFFIPNAAMGGLDGIVCEGGLITAGITAPQRVALAANQAAYYGYR